MSAMAGIAAMVEADALLRPDPAAADRYAVFACHVHAFTVWLTVLAEEVGEAAQAVLHAREARSAAGIELCLYEARSEVVQVAAVAVAWIEYFDRQAMRALTAVGRGEVRGPVPAAARDIEPGPRDRWTPSCRHDSPVFGCGPCEEGRS